MRALESCRQALAREQARVVRQFIRVRWAQRKCVLVPQAARSELREQLRRAEEEAEEQQNQALLSAELAKVNCHFLCCASGVVASLSGLSGLPRLSCPVFVVSLVSLSPVLNFSRF